MPIPDDTDDDVLARRLRQAALHHQPPVPPDLALRIHLAVQQDVQRRRRRNRRLTWGALLAASLLVALTLGVVANTPTKTTVSTGHELTFMIPLSPWETLPDLPLEREWQRLQDDAGRAAQVAMACLPTLRTQSNR